jgi:hypothetical protein
MDKFKNSLLSGMGLLILVNMMVLLSLRSGVSQSTTTAVNKKPWQQEFITPSVACPPNTWVSSSQTK